MFYPPRFRYLAFVLAAAAGPLAPYAASAQNLTIGVRAGPESIDPHYTATGTHAEALKHVFDTLVWSGDQLQLEPGSRSPGGRSTRPPGSSSSSRT
jgi:peptide/nickel transport system substrate-binding protein